MLLLVAELALATIALTTLSYITTASPEGHEEQTLTPPVEHQVEDKKLAPLPTTTAAMTDTVGTWSSPDPATAVELARQLNAAEAKLAVREAELATERAARAAAERMAASALVAAAEKEAALQAITSLTASRTASDGSDGSDSSDGKGCGSPGLRWLGLSCDSTVAPEAVAAGSITPLASSSAAPRRQHSRAPRRTTCRRRLVSEPPAPPPCRRRHPGRGWWCRTPTP